MFYHTVIDPFIQFGFMRRALVACLALSLSITVPGVFLLLRRMSLAGDALSHAILPGVSIGYLMYGMSLVAMGFGGFIAGLLVALASGWVSNLTPLREDASFAGFYLGSLALGVTLVSLHGSSVDLLHMLFGSILAVDRQALFFVGYIATFTLLCIALLYRLLVMEAFDKAFLTVNARRAPGIINALFMTLVVLNLVAGFQILGTLMTVGLMMLPAISARCWVNRLPALLTVSAILTALSAFTGLVLSFNAGIPAGPAIVLTAAFFFMVSILFGAHNGLIPVFGKRTTQKETS